MLTTSNNTRFAIVVLSLGLVAATTQFADAGVRRAEGNMRLANQNFRIDKERASGKITAARANFLHSEDKTLRNEERMDAKFDKGHITGAEQKSLNQVLNGVSKQIK